MSDDAVGGSNADIDAILPAITPGWGVPSYVRHNYVPSGNYPYPTSTRQLLLKRLPAFRDSWSDEVKVAWLTAMTKLFEAA